MGQFGLRFVVPQVALEDYEALTACADKCSEGHSCYTDAGDFYTKDIEGARLIKKGILKGWGGMSSQSDGAVCTCMYILYMYTQSIHAFKYKGR